MTEEGGGRSGMETFGNSLLKNEVVTKSVESSDFIDYGATDSVTWLNQDQAYGWGIPFLRGSGRDLCPIKP